jgi:hypothetical protein
MGEIIGIINSILSIGMIITFFVISYRIVGIRNLLECFIKHKLPNNKKISECRHCNKENILDLTKKCQYTCSKCNRINWESIPGCDIY